MQQNPLLLTFTNLKKERLWMDGEHFDSRQLIRVLKIEAIGYSDVILLGHILFSWHKWRHSWGTGDLIGLPTNGRTYG